MFRNKIIESLFGLLPPEGVFLATLVDGLSTSVSLKKEEEGGGKDVADFSHVCTNMCHPRLWNFFNPSRFVTLSLLSWIRFS